MYTFTQLCNRRGRCINPLDYVLKYSVSTPSLIFFYVVLFMLFDFPIKFTLEIVIVLTIPYLITKPIAQQSCGSRLNKLKPFLRSREPLVARGLTQIQSYNYNFKRMILIYVQSLKRHFVPRLQKPLCQYFALFWEQEPKVKRPPEKWEQTLNGQSRELGKFRTGSLQHVSRGLLTFSINGFQCETLFVF